jgi:hypothetical protein
MPSTVRLQKLVEDRFGERARRAGGDLAQRREVLAFRAKPVFDPNLSVEGIDVRTGTLNESLGKPLNRALRGTHQVPPTSSSWRWPR